ncbi:MarR family transcriptional regulator [Micromonospora sp. DT227]|uniref:MarR family transcriptional regulator n=1 Tax=Micromonospora sp. DT227 TaxID=3393433 RepID=UPI003CE82726
MTDAPEPAAPHAMFKVLAALAELGEDTAAAVADKAGLAYSTATAKLRAWEATRQAERVHTDSKRAVWRLTDAGRATVGTVTAPPPPTSGTDTPSPNAADDLTESADANASAETAPHEAPLDGERERADVDDTSPAPPAQPAAPADLPTAVDRQQEPTTGASTIATDPTEDIGEQTPATDPAGPPGTDTPRTGATSAGRPRRAMGSLRAAVLDVLEARPEQAFKTSELCKLIDAANAGTDARKASPGAVANAADKLVIAGKAIRTADKPATIQLAPTP